MARPMRETNKAALRVDFDLRFKVEVNGAKVTSDAGLSAYRPLDEALGLTDDAGRSFRRLADRPEGQITA